TRDRHRFFLLVTNTSSTSGRCLGLSERTVFMKLYPRIIPAIARDVVGSLMAEGDIEVETMRVADAEMDMAAILKEYPPSEERVNQATREALERRGYDHPRL